MEFFALDKKKCVKDGICTAICPTGAIAVSNDGYPVEASHSSCIKCGQCVSYCPTDACKITDIKGKYKNFDRKSLAGVNSPKIFDKIMMSRRSIRRFETKNVSKELMEEIFEVAKNAPTAVNVNGLRWIIIDGASKVKEVADAMAKSVDEIVKHKDLPDEYRESLKKLEEIYNNGYDIFLRNAPMLALCVCKKDYYWYEDGVIAATYLELASHAHGLGTCWAGYLMYMSRYSSGMNKAMGLKDDEILVSGLMLGYPLYKNAFKIPPRKLDLTWVK